MAFVSAQIPKAVNFLPRRKKLSKCWKRDTGQGTTISKTPSRSPVAFRLPMEDGDIIEAGVGVARLTQATREWVPYDKLLVPYF